MDNATKWFLADAKEKLERKSDRLRMSACPYGMTQEEWKVQRAEMQAHLDKEWELYNKLKDAWR